MRNIISQLGILAISLTACGGSRDTGSTLRPTSVSGTLSKSQAGLQTNADRLQDYFMYGPQ